MSELKRLGSRPVSRRTFLKGAGVAAGALALGHLGSFGQAEFIQIGADIPLTGTLKSFGPRFQVAAQLAIDELNAAGGPGGRRLNLLVRDSGTDPAIGVAAAQQLVASGVQVIFGAAASGVTIPISSVTIPNKVLLISPSATSPAISTLKDDDYVFRTAPSDALQGIVAADQAFNKKGYRKIAIIARNDAYGSGLQASLKANFEKLGGTVTATPLYDPKTTDFSAEIAAAKAGNPDAISLITFDEGEALIKQLEAAGVSNWDLLVDGNKNQDLLNRLKESFGGPAKLAGKVGTAPATAKTDGGVLFSKAYEDALKEPPFVFTANSFDALAVVGLAIAKASLVNGGKAPTGTEIRDQMRFVANPPGDVFTVGGLGKALEIIAKGGDVNFEGASGSVDFDANGDVPGPEGTWSIDANGNIVEGQVVDCKFDDKGAAVCEALK